MISFKTSQKEFHKTSLRVFEKVYFGILRGVQFAGIISIKISCSCFFKKNFHLGQFDHSMNV